MNEIIASGQQLTGLKLHWQFASWNARLEQAIADGSNGVAEDFYKEQGGVPEIPFDIEDYQALLIPLITFMANPGAFRREDKDSTPTDDKNDTKKAEAKQEEARKEGSTRVFMALARRQMQSCRLAGSERARIGQRVSRRTVK
ncbi:hypothetical protein [Bradyrhizobium sp. WSM1417]|uniref:hypothetical protein n=1 Tax=Bradyrhizobium sp. WSM1417 TaxID=754500 RepID=UPI000489EC5B|nr:hypothetical protein [Bradyrhizobium sp. WSM1417]